MYSHLTVCARMFLSNGNGSQTCPMMDTDVHVVHTNLHQKSITLQKLIWEKIGRLMSDAQIAYRTCIYIGDAQIIAYSLYICSTGGGEVLAARGS